MNVVAINSSPMMGKGNTALILDPLFRDAEIWVFATPLFVDGMSGPLKTLVDRMIPLIQPFVEVVDGRCRHPRRPETKGGQVVLVSNCGFWELENFEPLLVHLHAICKNIGREFAGALLRPHGPALGAMLKRGLPARDVLEAAEAAGRELVANGRMKSETLGAISRELIPKQLYIENMNENFGAAIERWAERRKHKSP